MKDYEFIVGLLCCTIILIGLLMADVINKNNCYKATHNAEICNK